MTPAQRITAHFGGDWKSGSGLFPTPGHSDRDRGMSVKDTDDGDVLIHCFNGDKAIAIAVKDQCRSLGFLPERSKCTNSSDWCATGTFDFRDECGNVLYRTKRLERRGEPKRFVVERPDGRGGWTNGVGNVRRVLYRLPELLEADPTESVYLVEGERKADKLASWGFTATAIAFGCKGWRREYAEALKGRYVVILPDNDDVGRDFARDAADDIKKVGGESVIVELPGLPPKGDIIDWTGTSDELHSMVEAKLAEPKAKHSPAFGDDAACSAFAATAEAPAAAEPPNVITLDECHAVFRRWLGESYDIEALDAVLAAAAAERLGGDPLWLLLVSGSGNAKTETVGALNGLGAHVVSTITSDAALLSGSPRKQRAKNATGGLLRKVGDHGLLVIKDMTSILSMNRDSRASVLAALREIHDGRWVRNLGTDGGQTLSWSGRCVIVGAVTTAWDAAHSVIAAMGDRFLLVRMDSTTGRSAAGRQARRNVGHEEQMRAELAAAVAGVIAGADENPEDISDEEAETLLAAANLVTLARTGVEYDYRGDVIDAHAPEMPTRFMKQLVQMMRGALAIGLSRDAALRLAARCARDSMPPLRLALIDDLAQHPASTATDVRKRIDKPRSTVDRQLQALHMLHVLTLYEEERSTGGTFWRYSLAQGIDATAIVVPEKSPPIDRETKKEGQQEGEGGVSVDRLSLPTNISGTNIGHGETHAGGRDHAPSDCPLYHPRMILAPGECFCDPVPGYDA